MAVRTGVLLIVVSFLCWAMLPLVPVLGVQGRLIPVAIGGLVVGAEITFWLGLVLVGRDTWRLARRHGWRRVPGALWHLLRDGRAPAPESEH